MITAKITAIGTIIGTGLTWSAAKLGSLVLADTTAGELNDKTLIPIGIAVACTVVIMACVWKAATAFQQISDRLSAVEREVKDLKDKP